MIETSWKYSESFTKIQHCIRQVHGGINALFNNVLIYHALDEWAWLKYTLTAICFDLLIFYWSTKNT